MPKGIHYVMTGGVISTGWEKEKSPMIGDNKRRSPPLILRGEWAFLTSPTRAWRCGEFDVPDEAGDAVLDKAGDATACSRMGRG